MACACANGMEGEAQNTQGGMQWKKEKREDGLVILA